MDYRLSVFQAVADQQSLTKAARGLHLSQPAVTKHIRLLEEQIGQPLFHRSAKGVTLTRAGAVLLQHAREVARLDQEVLQRIRGSKGIISGKLHVGVTTTIEQYLLPNWLVRSRRALPALQLKIFGGNTEDIVEAATERKIDLGLIEGRCRQVGLQVEPFLDDEIICVASPRHPAARGKPLSLAGLRQQTWVFREKGSGTRDIVERALRQHGIDPRGLNIDMELGSSEAIKAIVAAGHSLSFLSRHVVAREMAQGALRPVSVRGFSILRPLSFVYARGPRPTGAAGAFLDLVRRCVDESASGTRITLSYDI